MRYIFFGTPRFAEMVLNALIHADMKPVALVCNPDRPVGRKKIITAPETKRLAVAYPEITVLQPEVLDATFEKELRELKPDFFIVAAYAKIIPKAVLAIPAQGALGVHPSLLPKYRGASPIQSAILGGEQETGVTIYRMDEKMDHGEILAHHALRIPDGTTYPRLEQELAELGGKLLVETLPKFMSGKIKGVIQDEHAATFTKKFKTEDGYVSPKDLKDALAGDPKKAGLIDRKIRAFNPEPGVWTMENGKRLKLLEAKLENNALRLTTTQREGERMKRLVKI